MTDKKLTPEAAFAEFQTAYLAKKELLKKQNNDFLYAFGSQWSDEDLEKLRKAGITPVVDNRIATNIYLLTGLERQNRTDFRAFPEGEEDSIKAEIVSGLFKHSIKMSEYQYKSSDQFKDGVTCGESHLEPYLDYSDNLINGKPKWKKLGGNLLFPDPASKEYDLSDAKYVFKVTTGLSKEDLISLFPERKKKIKELQNGKIEFDGITGGQESHLQYKDYPSHGGERGSTEDSQGFDLLERYYKKWVDNVFICDKKTGEIKEVEDEEKAESFISEYKRQIKDENEAHEEAVVQHQMSAQERLMLGEDPSVIGEPPQQPTPKKFDRYFMTKKSVPEIWVYSTIPGLSEPLADERAWYYPKWKKYHFMPYFARFSTAPIVGKDKHLLVQGIVRGVKDAQDRHNRASVLLLRHLNASTNSGWLTEEDSWVDRKKVEEAGTNPAVNLEYKRGRGKPERIYPMAISQGHMALAADSAEDIKSQLGINADLLAVSEGGSASGRAIALRQRQGMLMIQELYDNLSRSRKMAGQFLLSQLGAIYDSETAQKVLGKSLLKKLFPPPMMTNPENRQPEPMTNEDGSPMEFDKEMAETVIMEVLAGKTETYDITVGESVASETMRMANSNELREFSGTYPGLIPPEILIEESQLPSSTKLKVIEAIKSAQEAQAQAQQAQQAQQQPPNLPPEGPQLPNLGI